MHDSFWNAFMVEMCNFFAKNKVFQEGGSAKSCAGRLTLAEISDSGAVDDGRKSLKCDRTRARLAADT